LDHFAGDLIRCAGGNQCHAAGEFTHRQVRSAVALNKIQGILRLSFTGLDGIGIESMMFAPLGAGPECLGCMALTRALVPQMKTLFPSGTIFFDRLTIPQLASAQARLTIFISNDTGPAHIAAAVGTPVVVILDQPHLNSFLPVGEQNRFIPGAKISEIPVADVYRAAAASR
jgi:hypothetical protein